jgi:hypothetical protein
VQPGLVGRVLEGAEDDLLGGRRRGKHRQRGGRVGGDHDAVERVRHVRVVPDLEALTDAGDGAHRRRHLHGGQPFRGLLHVAGRSADHGLPLVRPADREQPVVREEGEQVAGRVLHRQLRTGRPDRRDDGHRERVDEVAGEAVRPQELAERDLLGELGVSVEHPPGGAVEAQHLGEHREVARVREVALLREQPGRAACPGVLQPGRVVPHAHRHLGVLRGHAELAEQADEVRVGRVVVDDEARVDADVRQVVGVRVPAEARLGLEERDVVRALQDVGGRQAGHTGPDHGDAFTGHGRLLRLRRG